MENNKEQNRFSYTYSAKEQAELKRIRAKYVQKAAEEDKMARLRRLDASVTNTAQAVAIIFGVIGTLVLGFGMSLCMTDIAAKLGIGSVAAIAAGVIFGISGGVIASLAYPIYNVIVKAKRNKIAPEILRLTDELMK